jgi:death on curing protein
VSEYVWLLPEVVLAIHGRQIAEHGGDPGLRDVGLFESGLPRGDAAADRQLAGS